MEKFKWVIHWVIHDIATLPPAEPSPTPPSTPSPTPTPSTHPTPTAKSLNLHHPHQPLHPPPLHRPAPPTKHHKTQQHTTRDYNNPNVFCSTPQPAIRNPQSAIPPPP